MKPLQTPRSYRKSAARFTAACMFLAGLSHASQLHSAVLISHSGQTLDDNWYSLQDSLSNIASDFITGSQPATISSASIVAANPSSSARSIYLSIWSDNSGVPGSMLSAFDTTISVGASVTAGTYSATTSGISLSANTKYWFVAKGDNQSYVDGYQGVRLTQVTPSSGVFDSVSSTQLKFSGSGGSTWINQGSLDLSYELQGSVSAVPEPHTYAALFGIGLTGFAAFHRRNRVKSKA